MFRIISIASTFFLLTCGINDHVIDDNNLFSNDGTIRHHQLLRNAERKHLRVLAFNVHLKNI